jgi:hypothetical protein
MIDNDVIELLNDVNHNNKYHKFDKISRNDKKPSTKNSDINIFLDDHGNATDK